MQTLPANGQAQTLPAKWVIVVTKENLPMVIEWAKLNYPSKSVFSGDIITHDGFTCIGLPPNHEPITDSQFKAMVEGEGKPTPFDQYVKEVYGRLNALGHSDLAASLKAKHPDIWPVDHAAIVLEKAVAWYEDLPVQNNQQDCELRYAVRNYLTNQK